MDNSRGDDFWLRLCCADCFILCMISCSGLITVCSRLWCCYFYVAGYGALDTCRTGDTCRISPFITTLLSVVPSNVASKFSSKTRSATRSDVLSKLRSVLPQENQESKRKGARSVAAYMQLSDAVFTPYAESLYPTSGGDREVRTWSPWWEEWSGPGRGRGGHR